MKESIKNYIELFEKTLNMSGICWWIIDFKNNTNSYYFNKSREDALYLVKSLEFDSV